MFLGQLGCEALNFALKRLIKEERPALMNGKGYGMPSSHAQFASFWAVALVGFLLGRYRPVEVGRVGKGEGERKRLGYHQPEYYHTPLSYLQRVGLSLLTVAVAAAVASSRIYLDYHTPSQVLVGCGAGAGSAVVWFGVTEWARRRGWVRWAVDSWVGRLGRWRDLVVEEDLAEAGWRRWCERREEGHHENGVPVGKKVD